MKGHKTPLSIIILLTFGLLLIVGCGKSEHPLDNVLKTESGDYDQSKVDAANQLLQAIDSYNSSYPSNPINANSFFSGVNQGTFKNLKDKGINSFSAIPGMIDNLNSQIEDAKALAPKFVMVNKGDTEKSLRLKVLTEEYGLGQEEAADMIKGLQMCANVQAGWKMWYIYNPDTKEFATAFTKGDASVSPRGAQGAMMEQANITWGNKFVPYLNKISGLETEIDNVKNDISSIKENIEKTKNYYNEKIDGINDEFKTHKNTMRYITGSQQDLEAKSIIKKDDVLGYDYGMMKEFDIRDGSLELPFSAAGYKEVVVLPTIFNPTDYSITQSGGKYVFKINSGRETKFLQNIVFFVAK